MCYVMSQGTFLLGVFVCLYLSYRQRNSQCQSMLSVFLIIMLKETKKRRPRFAHDELDVLVDAVGHKSVIFNKFTDVITNEKKRAAWDHITKKINAVSAVSRTTDEVRRKWQDWASCTKGKEMQRKKERQKTGGGKAEDIPVNEQEEKVLAILGKTATEGIQGGIDSIDVTSETTPVIPPSVPSTPTQTSAGIAVTMDNDTSMIMNPRPGTSEGNGLTDEMSVETNDERFMMMSPIAYPSAKPKSMWADRTMPSTPFHAPTSSKKDRAKVSAAVGKSTNNPTLELIEIEKEHLTIVKDRLSVEKERLEVEKNKLALLGKLCGNRTDYETDDRYCVLNL